MDRKTDSVNLLERVHFVLGRYLFLSVFILFAVKGESEYVSVCVCVCVCVREREREGEGKGERTNERTSEMSEWRNPCLVWIGYINYYRLFNAKSFLYICIKYVTEQTGAAESGLLFGVDFRRLI